LKSGFARSQDKASATVVLPPNGLETGSHHCPDKIPANAEHKRELSQIEQPAGFGFRNGQIALVVSNHLVSIPCSGLFSVPVAL
jgi:hypothetical protein